MSSTVLFFPLGEDLSRFPFRINFPSYEPAGVVPVTAPELDFPSLYLPSG